MLELEVDFNATHGRGVIWTVVDDADAQLGRQVIVSEPDEGLRFYGVICATHPAKTEGRTAIDIRVGPEWVSVV